MTWDMAAVRKAHKALIADVRREIDEALVRAGEHAQDHVRTQSEFERRSATRSVKDATKAQLVRVAGGKLVRLTNSKMVKGFNVSAGLEHGTRAHKIRSRTGVLRFRSGSSTVFRREVNHPGTRAYRFFSSAASSAHAALGASLQTRLSTLARRF